VVVAFGSERDALPYYGWWCSGGPEKKFCDEKVCFVRRLEKFQRAKTKAQKNFQFLDFMGLYCAVSSRSDTTVDTSASSR
jgi:hypothetical protein